MFHCSSKSARVSPHAFFRINRDAISSAEKENERGRENERRDKEGASLPVFRQII